MPISMKKVKQPSLYFLVFVVLGTKLPFSVYVDYNLPLKKIWAHDKLLFSRRICEFVMHECLICKIWGEHSSTNDLWL